jgi:hypothetical protein
MARATAFRLGHRVIFSPMPVAAACTSISACTMPTGAPVTYDPQGRPEFAVSL